MRMLFLRDFRGLTGGHVKYLDYVHHTKGVHGIEPELFLTPSSITDSSNPFLSAGVPILNDLTPADSYFIGGMDWRILEAAGIDLGSKPVVNLVQHVSHADPNDPKFDFLSRPALRICVSAEVERAVCATGRAAGPIIAIENGIDVGDFEAGTRPPQRSGILIVGYKSPQCAQDIRRRLRDLQDVSLADTFLPRTVFLQRIACARICVLLPNPTEGFYLPALEAMALGTPVIVPDCVGNRSYCVDGHSCVMPIYDANAIAESIRDLTKNEPLLAALSSQGRIVAARHTIERERELYRIRLLDYLKQDKFS